MQILIINLPSAKARLSFQQRQCQSLSLNYEILKAVSITDVSEKTYQAHAQDWQRPLRKSEVACYFSHRDAWKKVIEYDKPILIVEDDALFSKNLPQLLSTLENHSNIDFINLEVRGRKKIISNFGESINCNSNLFRLYQDRTGAAGYILWPSGAYKLLNHEKNSGIALADAHITSCPNLIAYQIEPAPLIQLDQCEHYNIIAPLETESHISTHQKPVIPQKNLLFKVRRFFAQVKMGLRQAKVSYKSKKRYITINPKDFNI